MDPRRVLRAVAEVSNLEVKTLVGRRRTRHVAFSRHVAMWILRSRTPMSLPEIGFVVGGRDHTTVLAGVRKIDRLAQRDAGAAAFLADCLCKLEEPPRLRIAT